MTLFTEEEGERRDGFRSLWGIFKDAMFLPFKFLRVCFFLVSQYNGFYAATDFSPARSRATFLVWGPR